MKPSREVPAPEWVGCMNRIDCACGAHFTGDGDTLSEVLWHMASRHPPSNYCGAK